jgi:hypothetical protein
MGKRGKGKKVDYIIYLPTCRMLWYSVTHRIKYRLYYYIDYYIRLTVLTVRYLHLYRYQIVIPILLLAFSIKCNMDKI